MIVEPKETPQLSAETVERFREILLEHARAPRNTKILLTTGSVVHRGHSANPLCGDDVQVEIEAGEITFGRRIDKIRITPQGCAICLASASLMSELVVGQNFDEARRLQRLFAEAVLASADSAWPQDLAPLVPLSHLRVSPARVPCSLIAWYALKDALAASARGEVASEKGPECDHWPE